MTKTQYQNLLSYRRSQELMLYLLVKNKAKDIYVRDIIRMCEIPYKRAEYILSKWCDRGYYDFGVALDLGWIDESREFK